MKISKKKNSEESRKFWETAKEISKKVADYPEWKKQEAKDQTADTQSLNKDNGCNKGMNMR